MYSPYLTISRVDSSYPESPYFRCTAYKYDANTDSLKNKYEMTLNKFVGNYDRFAFYILNIGNADKEKIDTRLKGNSYVSLWVDCTETTGSGSTQSGVLQIGTGFSIEPQGIGNTGGRYPEKIVSHVYTNIPIFDNPTDCNNYVTSGEGIEKSLNYNPPTLDYTYYVRNKITQVTYDLYGNVVSRGIPDIRYVNFANSNEKLALYKSDNALNIYNLALVNNYSCEYTTDDKLWIKADTSPITNFLDSTIKKGIIVYETYFETNIPIFENEEKATLYVNGNIGIEDSLNYDDITKDDYKKGNIGEEIVATENGVPYNSNIFAQKYILSKSALVEIGNAIYSTDTEVIESILNGTKLFGGNSMNCIVGLQYYPIDVNTVTTTSEQNHISIGSYLIDMENTVNKVLYNNKMLDCGNAFFNPIYNDFRDFEPYTTLYVYLPYIGVHNIDISKYLNKNISLKYAIDLSTGMCTAFLYGDGVLLDSFDGRMAIEKPITSIDNMQYVSSVADGVIATGNSFIGTLSGTIPKQGTNEVNAGLQGLQSVGNALSTVKMGFDVAQNVMNLPIRERGTFSPTISEFAPQYPYFIFVQCETVIPQNEQNIVGYPSNIGGNILSFSGFLKCSNVKLNNINLTEKEKSELEAILKSGVYL